MSKFTPLSDDLHQYVIAHGARQDEVLRRVQEETAQMGGIAVMQIAPDQGAFMTMLCSILGARDALELGTFTGYSAICIARGLADGGRLIACELDDEYARVAAANFEAAGVADRVEIRAGPALETLRSMPAEPGFDFAFIDADKTGYPAYYEEVLPRMRAGGVIAVDNVLQGGDVLGGTEADRNPESVAAIRELNETIATDERVDVVMLAIADGLTLARKR